MAGYLDQYGAGDERREKMNRWLIVSGGAALLILLSWWFLYGWDKSEIVREPHVARLVQKLRNHRQEGEVRQFMELLKDRQYQQAYQLWGPSRDYPFSKFMEDWGPQSGRPLSAFEVVRSRSCGSGVVVTVDLQKGADEKDLWVQKNDRTIGFSPFPGCPAGRTAF
jgi:hypothetical protein